MPQTWYENEDGTVDYECTTKLDNQTLLLAAQELSRTNDTIYWNIWLTLSNKRSQRVYNEDHCLSTGLNPFATYRAALCLLKKAELGCQIEYPEFNHMFVVGWVDKRRRDAYEKVLSKYGYQMGRFERQKRLIKYVKKGSIEL